MLKKILLGLLVVGFVSVQQSVAKENKKKCDRSFKN